MLLRALRFLTILATALSTGLSFAHLLEMPAKLRLPADLWVTIQLKGLYVLFGTVGGPVEVLSVLLAVGLCGLSWRRRPAAWYALAGAICLAVALTVWLAVVNTANAELATWTPTAFPADWARYRDQWETGHAAMAVVKILGLSLLVLSALVETPLREAGSPETGSPRRVPPPSPLRAAG